LVLFGEEREARLDLLPRVGGRDGEEGEAAGEDGVEHALRERRRRALAERLRALPSVSLVAAPELALLVFWARPPGVSEACGEGAEAETTDAWSRRLLAKVNAKQRVFLTGTASRGRFLIRMCVLSFRTHRDRVEMALADIEEGIRELEREG